MDQQTWYPPSMDEETQRRSVLLLQAIPISLIPIIGSILIALLLRFVLRLPEPVHVTQPGIDLLTGVTVVVIVVSALIMLVRLGLTTISTIGFISAWTLVVTYMILENGITSMSPALMLLPICAAGLLLDGLASVSLAALATLLVGAFSILQFNGLALGENYVSMLLSRQAPLFAGIFWISLFWMIAAMTWLLARGLKQALDHSRVQATELHKLSMSLEHRVAAQTTELEQRAQRAEVLYEISRALTNTLDVSKTINLIAARATQLLRFDSAFVLLAAEEAVDGLIAVGEFHRLDCPLNLSDMPLSNVRTWYNAADPVEASLPDPGSGQELAVLALPTHHGNTVRGVLLLVTRGTQPVHSDEDRALAKGLADQAAVAIAQAQLIQRLHESATLEERARLAREIHDTLAQGLTGIVVQLGTAEQSLEDAPDEVHEHLFLARKMAREALAEARRSVWNLRAPALDHGDLAEALRSLVARSSTPATAVHFEQRGMPWSLSRTIESALLRVVQEALANVAKHSRATSASVVLEYGTNAVAVTIQDNGVGIDMARLQYPIVTPGPWGGFGLLGMRERLAAHQGTLDISNAKGTLVRATIPRYADMPLFRLSDVPIDPSPIKAGSL